MVCQQRLTKTIISEIQLEVLSYELGIKVNLCSNCHIQYELSFKVYKKMSVLVFIWYKMGF
jgi:hypothetical protein